MSGPNYRFCRYETDGPLLTITLDRPEVLNALHREAHFECADAFDRYASDPDLRVAIVTGCGERAFCVGLGSQGADRQRRPYQAGDGVCRDHASL